MMGGRQPGLLFLEVGRIVFGREKNFWGKGKRLGDILEVLKG